MVVAFKLYFHATYFARKKEKEIKIMGKAKYGTIFSHELVATILVSTFMMVVTCEVNISNSSIYDVLFRYYNKDHPTGEIIIDPSTVNEEKLKGWRKNTPLKIITHGWLGDDQADSVLHIKDAYLEKWDYNIITVDWSKSSKELKYSLIVERVGGIGKNVADLVNVLVAQKLVTTDNIHLIGFSAGAHVMGIAGKHIKCGLVNRITGLDPAGPEFQSMTRPNEQVLDYTDAFFVDIIHTSRTYGYTESLGDVDFWPNNNKLLQPGCMRAFCNHLRAVNFYTDSIRYPHTFKAWQCNNSALFTEGHCKNNPTIYMGEETPSNAVGNYYLITNSESPFGKGDSGDTYN